MNRKRDAAANRAHQAAYREKMRSQGLVPTQVYCRPEDRQAVRDYALELAKKAPLGEQGKD
jgi:hypothetical protein